MALNRFTAHWDFKPKVGTYSEKRDWKTKGRKPIKQGPEGPVAFKTGARSSACLRLGLDKLAGVFGHHRLAPDEALDVVAADRLQDIDLIC